MKAQDAATHYTPEEPDQPACDADTAADVPAVMFGTLNPDHVTCPDCRKILGGEPSGYGCLACSELDYGPCICKQDCGHLVCTGGFR